MLNSPVLLQLCWSLLGLVGFLVPFFVHLFWGWGGYREN